MVEEEGPFTPFKYIYANILRRPHMSVAMIGLLTVSSLLLLQALSFSFEAGSATRPESTLWGETPVKPLLEEMGFGEEISSGARRATLGVFYISSAVSLLSGYILLRSAFTISMKERRREVELLKALGFSRGEVAKLLVGEGVVLALLSGVLALFIAMHLFVNLGAYMISRGETSLFFTQPRISPLGALLHFAVLLILVAVALAGAIREVEREEGSLL